MKNSSLSKKYKVLIYLLLVLGVLLVFICRMTVKYSNEPSEKAVVFDAPALLSNVSNHIQEIYTAQGIYKDTGEKYYIDWEWNETSKNGKITPCVLKLWDAEKDKDVFKKCSEIFDRIEQGDWSDVPPIEGMEYMWEINGTDGDWIRVDVNNDGMPELISQCGNGSRTENKKPIDLIFAWNSDKVELVYTDLIDSDQFYYYSGNGSLIYETGAVANYASYSKCIFDTKWKLKNIYTLKFDRETVETDDGYEVNMTFYSVRPKTKEELMDNPDNEYQVQEMITKEQFLKYYKEMTGVDFLRDNETWEWEFIYE